MDTLLMLSTRMGITAWAARSAKVSTPVVRIPEEGSQCSRRASRTMSMMPNQKEGMEMPT